MDINQEIEKNRGDHHASEGEDDRFWGDVGAGILVRAEDTGRYLLMLRSAHVNEPHTWHMVSGKVDLTDGETDPQTAALRELQEETGYTGQISLSLIDVFEHGSFKFYNYAGTVPAEFEPKHSWESEDHVWADKKNFPAPLHFGLNRIMRMVESSPARGFISLLN